MALASENGWQPRNATADMLEWVTIPGADPTVRLQVQKGWPSTLLRAWAADYNAFVEPLRDADSASFTATNSVPTSNHLNGTAMDLNWNSHPFRVNFAGYTPQMVAVMEEMEDFYEGTMFWAQRWDEPKDAMHHQLGYNTYGNPAVQDFIDRKIRPDGFSTFRRGPMSDGLTAEALSDAMGASLPLWRYEQLLPAFRAALNAAECWTVERVAMFCAQVGHESHGLEWMEELADGSAYEGRCSDLGNCYPGDGVRFKGRGPIQITGRAHYASLSSWAAARGFVPSATYFVDNPAELASDEYGFIGVVWYWTVARDMNSFADAEDIVGATRAVNGGTNGLEDRRARWRHCLSLGTALLPGSQEDDMANIFEQRFTNWQGNSVSLADYFFYTDKYIGLILDQLVGPDSRARSGEPTRWPELGDQTFVEALAEVGVALKIPGFKKFEKE